MFTERPFFDRNVEILKAVDLLKNASQIGFDADRVLINSKKPVISEFNRIFKSNYSEEAIDSWYAVANLAMLHGVKEKRAVELDRALWTSPRILGESVPCRGAIPLTLKLAATGKRIMVVTSRIP